MTGGSKGIGRAISRRLAVDGFDIVVHYRRDRRAALDVASAIDAAGGQARVLGFDVRDRGQARHALETEVERGGAFWGIVLNAGVTRDKAFPAQEDADWDDVMRTNLDGFYNVIRPLVMPMIHLRDGGRIVTMSSVSGIMGNRGQVNYSASKAGLIGATKALAIELAKRDIAVNSVAPGLIESAMTEGVPAEEVARLVPMRRMGQPEEVAALVGFLFSDPAVYITRQVISVNGGLA